MKYQDCPCGVAHGKGDPMVGSPLDHVTYDLDGLLDWNAVEHLLWKDSIAKLRKSLAEWKPEFLWARELQSRAAVHRHVILRFPPGAQITERVLQNVFRSAQVSTLRELALRSPGGRKSEKSAKWGKSIDIVFLDAKDAAGMTLYLTKYLQYVTKDYTEPGGSLMTLALLKAQQRAWNFQCSKNCLPCYGHGDCSSDAYGQRGNSGCVGLNVGEAYEAKGSCSGCKSSIHQNVMGSRARIGYSRPGWSFGGWTKSGREKVRQDYAARQAEVDVSRSIDEPEQARRQEAAQAKLRRDAEGREQERYLSIRSGQPGRMKV